jgi:Mg2+ and Co2+ transporter CorA
MSTALRPLQDVRPTAEPQSWSCYADPNGGIRQGLSIKEIGSALGSGEGTLWVDIDTRSSKQAALLKDLFHFHPLAIEEAVNPESRDLLSSTLDSYLTQVSNRLGMATKALSLVATFTLPFVVISGMWGINFEHIPLHSNPSGFIILVFAQLALGLLILAGLKWRKLL